MNIKECCRTSRELFSWKKFRASWFFEPFCSFDINHKKKDNRVLKVYKTMSRSVRKYTSLNIWEYWTEFIKSFWWFFEYRVILLSSGPENQPHVARKPASRGQKTSLTWSEISMVTHQGIIYARHCLTWVIKYGIWHNQRDRALTSEMILMKFP